MRKVTPTRQGNALPLSSILMVCLNRVDDDDEGVISEGLSVPDVNVQGNGQANGDGSGERDVGVPAAAPIVLETLLDETELPLEFGVAQIEFEVAANVLSLSVTVHGESTGWYGIDEWVNGDGSHLATADWVAAQGNERGCVSCANFVHQSQGAATTIAPNRPGAVIKAGMHRLSVVGWEDGFGGEAVAVKIIAKTGRLPERGVLDLNFTDGARWTAESIQTDPYFAATIARVNALYGGIGIEVGDITFTDIDARFATSIAEGEDNLGSLVAQSTLDRVSGINIFFVDEILTGEPTSLPFQRRGVCAQPLTSRYSGQQCRHRTQGAALNPPGQRF